MPLKYGLPFPENCVAIDTETTGLHRWRGHKPFAISAEWVDGRSHFWRDEELAHEDLKLLLADPSLDKVMQNAKFDWGMLESIGLTVCGRIWDTGIFIHLLDGRDAEGGSRLNYASKKYLPSEFRKVVSEIENWFRERRIPRTRRDFSMLPPDILQRRCMGDTHLTMMLFKRVFATVAKTFPYLLDLEHRLIPIVKQMQDRGITVDDNEINRQIEYFESVVEDVTSFAQGVLNTPW